VSCCDPQRPVPPAFHFDLPPELIAQDPAQRRGDSRLLRVVPGGSVQGEAPFRQLVRFLAPGDLLVVNDSRVLPARLNARRPGGGRVELLLVRPESAERPEAWLALARPVRRLRRGQRLTLTDVRGEPDSGIVLELEELRGEGFVVVRCDSRPLVEVAERWGEIPLPPYIHRSATAPDFAARRHLDRQRYQTVYARENGSVAAPTAGLHFESDLLTELAAAGIGHAPVTLHVGPGTFRPPSTEQIAARRLHAEFFHYPAATDAAIVRTRDAGGRVVAVGTTSLRVLATVAGLRLAAATDRTVEFSAAGEAGSTPIFNGCAVRGDQGWEVTGWTRLFIQPPAPTGVDGLLTNFHLPGSSLLMLVAAVAGEATWRRAYAHAIASRFRFFSYGDAMLILPPTPEG